MTKSEKQNESFGVVCAICFHEPKGKHSLGKLVFDQDA
jgi:hypothetical protein